jgi:hypothetical protein
LEGGWGGVRQKRRFNPWPRVVLTPCGGHAGVHRCRFEECNTGYADDTGAWQVGDLLEDVKSALEVVAARFAAYTRGNGLALTAAKTQLMYNNTSKRVADFTVNVDGKVIIPSTSLELLGVKYDQQLSTKP